MVGTELYRYRVGGIAVKDQACKVCGFKTHWFWGMSS